MNAEEFTRLVKSMSEDVRRLNQNLLALGEAAAPLRLPHPEIKPALSPLAARFEQAWRAFGGPTLEKEFAFHRARKWRADYAHVNSGTLIELEGGIYGHSRHTQAQGFSEDARKYNAAVALGWSLFRLPTGFTNADVELILHYVMQHEVDDDND